MARRPRAVMDADDFERNVYCLLGVPIDVHRHGGVPFTRSKRPRSAGHPFRVNAQSRFPSEEPIGPRI